MTKTNLAKSTLNLVFGFCICACVCYAKAVAIDDEEWRAAYNLCTQDRQSQACLLLIEQGLDSVDECEEACNEIGTIYHSIGSDAGKIIATKYYAKAALKGNVLSVYNIGMIFYELKEYKEAREYFSLACDRGFPKACNNLGVLYRGGFGVAQDLAKAKSLYAKACNDKEPLGCYNLGFMYAFGIGVSQNIALARSYFGKACDLGSAQSCEINADTLQREDLQRFEREDRGFEI